MFCNKCGFKVNDGEKFCNNCGNKLENYQAITQQNTSSNINNQQQAYSKQTSKNKVKLSTIIIIVIVLFIAIIFGYKFIPGKYEENKYKREVSKYLEEKYNEKFDITFLYKANQAIPIWEDTYMGCCININKIGYVYTFSPKTKDDINYYIVYCKDTKENTKEIEELTDLSKYPQKSSELVKYPKIIYTYEESSKYYNEKQEIKDKLEQYLGENYKIDLYSDVTHIIVTPKGENLYENVSKTDEFNDLYKNLINLLNDKYIAITLKYWDKTLILNSAHLRSFNEKQEIKDMLREYLGNNYEIDLYGEDDRITAETYLSYASIMMTDEFEKLYTDVSKLLKDRSIEMFLKYADTEITIYRKQENIEPKIGIKNKLKQFLDSDYKIDIYSNYDSIIIKTNKTFENVSYNDSNNFIELYNNIIDALQGNSVWVNLQYRDKYIHIYEKTFKITDIDDIEITGEVYNVTGENYDN